MEELIKEHGGYIVIALLAISLAFILGYESGSQGQSVRTIIVQQTPNVSFQDGGAANLAAFQNISLMLPGVDQERHGVIANLQVERRNGTGRVFIDIDEGTPFIANETQTSIKTALRVARLFNDVSANTISTSDLYYSLKARTLEVGGSSAGAAITIGTIALLEGKQLNESIAISGTINPDGSIGPVGAILEKARALKTRGVVTFLVPVGEGIQTTQISTDTQTCSDETVNGQPFRNCRTETTVQQTTVNVSQETGMNIIEVPNISRAYYQMVVQ